MKSKRFSKLRVENLEERTLLAVMAGGTETAVRAVAPTEAVTWVVNTLEDQLDWNTDDEAVSLREAIERAADGDTVVFDDTLPGEIITLSGTELSINKGITIDASSIGGITIDGCRKSCVLHLGGGTKETQIELIDLTIIGGHADECGGGIYNDHNCSLILTHCTVSGNSAEYGGGIYNYNGGALTLIDSIVIWNTASVHGGGINIDGVGKITLTNSLVSENNANNGGGIYNNYGTLKMTGGAVTENNAGYCGGGFYNNGYLTIINSTISDNSAYGDDGYSTTSIGYGGGIYNLTSMDLTNCIIVRNTVRQDGGGIFNEGMSTIANTAVLENSADRNGGGIYNSSSNLTIKNSTISRNSAFSYGGGIYNTGTVRLYNSIIALNYYSDIYKLQGRINAYNSLSSFTGWILIDSLEYDPSKPLFTNAANGDYTLATNSQAVNVGNNDYVITDADLAGYQRIVSGIVDLGAYEYQGIKIEQLDVPTITTGDRGVYVSAGANRHQIIWDAVENASGYDLAYTDDGNSWTTISASGPIAVVTGLTYGQDIKYRVRALGEGSYADSDWSEEKTFTVCPMDINNDGDIGGLDRVILAQSWLAEEGDEDYNPAADIDGNGDVGGIDRAFLSQNWLGEARDDDLLYPTTRAADVVFDEFEPGDIDVELVYYRRNS